MIRLELRRMMRNKRTVVFTFIMPAVLFLLFGTNASSRSEAVGAGNVTGYIMVSMAVYGAMLATTSGGAMVSIERAAGWSRQLRLTPLKPVAYVAVKLTLAMIIGAASVAVTLAVGAASGAKLPTHAWIECGLLAWVCALVFAAFGLFMGYLLPSENVMQILGPVLAVLSFAGGLFVPLDALGHTDQARQAFMISLKLEPENPVAQHRLAKLNGEAVHEPEKKKRGWKIFGKRGSGATGPARPEEYLP